MTLENRKKRYEYFVKNNDTARAEELAKKYPDVKSVEKKEEPAKSKGHK